jgi:hypothetical protein
MELTFLSHVKLKDIYLMTLNEMIAEAQPSGLTGHLSAKELGTIV